jgi:hypothetical protein
MKLYRSINHPNQWFAFSQSTGWVMFPAEPGGWSKRQPARGMDPMYVREVPARLALDTGMPASPKALALSEAA